MDSDADFQREKAAFEEAARALIGQQIIAIHYYELQGEGAPPRWNAVSNQFHILDFGLEFNMASGKLFSFIWNRFGLYYGLSISGTSLEKELTNPAIWDVSHDPSWSLFTHRQIQNVTVYWGWWQTAQENRDKRYYYPQDIQILFDHNRSIVIGVYGYMPDKTLFPSADELIIFLDQDIARTYRVGPYGPLADN